VVIQTGRHTIFGRIAKLSSTGAPVRTTLQAEIARFVRIIVVLALFFGIIVTVLWGAWLNKAHYGFITSSGAVTNLVAVCVAFIPEGMPSAVTISLSVVASRLAKNKVLCKTLMTVETLGAVDILCSDKTGTLTKNRMTVASAAILDDEVSPEEARDRIVRGGDAGQGCKELAAVAAMCNAAVFDKSTMDQPIESRLVDGDATGESCLRLEVGSS
jgi:sodium/potassium-transporting ATPase subunit alpha